MDSFTIVLLVQTLSITQTSEGWFLQTSFLEGVGDLNGGFWPSKGAGF